MADILTTARDRFDLAVEADDDNRKEALDDLKFRAGEQWPEEIRQERTTAGRPTLTVNRMPQFVKQVTGDIRQNRPSIKVRPVDSGADPDLAEVITGIVRHIEQASDAQAAYVTAAESSATCGIGHFRIITEYVDDESFEQDIKIERIRNPFSVYWDPNAVKITREDARWCFVSERITLDEYKLRYPKGKTSDFEATGETEDVLSNWWDGETVRIAEYWVKESDDSVLEIDGQKRTVKKDKVRVYVLNGVEVLEGPSEWAGPQIPIIPVIGEEVHVGDRVVRHGIVRYAKDPQRLYNYWRTTAAESIALAPKAPWLVTPRMIEGQKAAWEGANKGNPPYLMYNADPTAPNNSPRREQPVSPPTAMWQEASIAADDMKGTTGIYDASLGAQGNETSGRAILARQQEGDTGTFVYIDNLSRSIRYAGKILIALIPKIYDTERVVRILGEDDVEDFVKLNVPVRDPETGEEVFATVLKDKKGNLVYKPALDAGKYDVEITTGPSYSTRRIEAADSILQFVQAVPQAGALVADLVAKNMDWPGADQIAERLKKALPPGIAEEDDLTPEEQQQRQALQQQQQQQQEMAQQIQLAQIQAEIAKSNAEAMKAQAAAAKDGASIGKIQAETEGTQIDNATKAMELAINNGHIDALVEQRVRQIFLTLTSQQSNFNT